MSAGSGLTHSEFNHSKTDKVNFLQLWVIPKERNIQPRYQQITFDIENRKNKIQTVVAPDVDEALWINQDAWFSLTDLSAGQSLDYQLHKNNNGVYAFLIEGTIEINEQKLEKRDGAGFEEIEQLTINASKDAQLLLIEVPMAI
jgi:redox-sensitive bicupin YhaK (pirin superfamily)